MKQLNSTKLPRIIFVDEDKCINCHACISVCPVKYCNDGSGDHVSVNPETCIGCGHCLEECTHDARQYIDDFDNFIEDMGRGEKVVAIAAPSVAANFPEQSLNFNGWLKSIGVEAVFDVSFGAELTTKSYTAYLEKHNPEVIIAQPCAAIVTYIELYLPELLEYLAPIDSPMLHTIKMIKRFFPGYSDYKVAVISPCIAKKREFVETGYGDYNLGYKSFDRYFKEKGISIDSFPKEHFENPAPERAVLFSTPGGLLKTMERWHPDISTKTRKAEGTPLIYEYLKKLPGVIEHDKGMAPLLVDCLSCDLGCNAGPLTLVTDKSPDEIEYWIEKRRMEMQEQYGTSDPATATHGRESIESVIDDFWEEGLYERNYIDRSPHFPIKIPNEKERKEIYLAMHKYNEEDIFNCSSCGYGRCEHMATAIFNGLNRPENCHHFLSSEREISKRKIIENEKRLRTILETTIEGFIQVDTFTVITKVNQAMAGILGVTENEIIGKSMFDYVDEENAAVIKSQLDVRSRNKASEYEVTLKCKDGSSIVCIFHATPLFNEDGSRIGSFAMVSDITERKKAEQELWQHRNNLEKLVKQRTDDLNEANMQLKEANDRLIELDKVKSDFVSSVSHELRTPLTSVLGFAQIIQMRLKNVLFPEITSDDKKVKRTMRQIDDNIEIIISEGKRLTSLINEVLDLAKMEAGKVEWHMGPVAMKDIIGQSLAVIESLSEKKSLSVIREIDEELPLVTGDANRLVQVVVNLLSNAIKFTDEGSITCRALKENEHIIVSVIDTGTGISEEDRKLVFDKFKQVGETLTEKPKGTGLGLVICREIIEHHNGRIWVESETGKGSTFSFSLPVPLAQSPKIRLLNKESILRELQERTSSIPSAVDTSKKTILVVDDDRNIRELLRQELESSNYTIIEAKDGFDAVEQVKKVRPDLIVLDIIMPGMSGFDVAAVVKNDPMTIGIPIIVLSVIEDRERGERLGIDRYYTKPVDSGELMKDIEMLLTEGIKKKKVIVVDKDESLVHTLSYIMRLQGYTVAEAFSGKECLEKTRDFKPDIVIADALIADDQKIVRSIRLKKGLEDVLFLLLGDTGEI